MRAERLGAVFGGQSIFLGHGHSMSDAMSISMVGALTGEIMACPFLWQ
ncbi:MAG: hypothetical protein ACJAVR_002171 [Paracoccaceae bacterium]|jgi:hypothetical protein